MTVTLRQFVQEPISQSPDVITKPNNLAVEGRITWSATIATGRLNWRIRAAEYCNKSDQCGCGTGTETV